MNTRDIGDSGYALCWSFIVTFLFFICLHDNKALLLSVLRDMI